MESRPQNPEFSQNYKKNSQIYFQIQDNKTFKLDRLFFLQAY